MPTNHLNRVLLILFVLWVAISSIYQRVPGSLFWLFNPTQPISLQHSLKPGIDMAGGTSLTYEIVSTTGDPNLAEQVTSALKERVDPQGVRNLIWRPQGGNRIEIQMPASGRTEQGEQYRKAYQDARDALEKTNIRVSTVLDVIQNTTGDERAAKIKEFAGDSPARLALLQKLAEASDQLKAARERKDVAAAAQARIELESLQQQLDQTNLPVPQLEAILDLQGQPRQQRLDELTQRFADFPARLAAIEQFRTAYADFAKVRDTLDDVAELKRLLRGSGVLSFNIVVEPSDPEYQPMLQRLREDGPRPQPGDTTRWFEVDRPEEFVGRSVPYNGKPYILARIDPQSSMMSGPGRPDWKLEEARRGSDERGRPAVDFRFDTAGAYLFGELTGRYKRTATRQYQMAMILDGKVLSAPSLPDRAIYGNGQITGDFSEADISYLTRTLTAGALPAQLTNEPISEITVGPQLGRENLKAGLISCVAGLVIVGIFLIGYYYLAGVIAFVAVLINLVIILGSMALLDASFTLPGVAGIVLSVAMAVDANVLIFERLREEQARGLSLRMALRNAYDRAFSAILDGQLTTAISSIFLYWFGSEEVKGFGLTLLIGIVTSLFTALYVTRTVFEILVDKFGVTDLGSLPRTFPRWNQMLTPRVDWVRWSWTMSLISVVFIVGGLALLGVKWAQNEALDIEFSGGTAVRIQMKEPTDREHVQDMVDQIAEANPQQLASPRVVAVGTERTEYSISTPTADTTAVQAVLVESLGDKLVVNQPSRFDFVDADFNEAMNQAIFPIESTQTRIEGVPAHLIQNHVNGVAIVLNNLSPPLTEEAIRDRVNQRAYQEANDQHPERIEVEVFDGGSRAVVLMSDSRYEYDLGHADKMAGWNANLAAPAWNIVKDAVHNPPQLRDVTSFTAQVAEEASWNTLLALTLSCFGIMLYVWLRFGNLKFGWATIIGCVHDAAFVMAAVGYSHYLGQLSIIENGLLIRPFRIDLTLIAAVLTVIGYSMNDTVVVFDRVRENRGKFGVLSRQVINDSINQTFSRTLLTGGTSLGILLVMYIIGGEGIHGFTFVMLLGIIAGTYSSVGIAAPLLLLGNTTEESTTLSKPVRPQPAAG